MDMNYPFPFLFQRVNITQRLGTLQGSKTHPFTRNLEVYKAVFGEGDKKPSRQPTLVLLPGGV